MGDLYGRKSIRGALKMQADAAALGRHALADLQVVERADHSNEVVGRGLALRQILYALLVELRPSAGKPDFTERRWRWFFMLQEQFFNGRSVQSIRAEMGVSESGYFTDQRRVLDYLGNRLREAELAVGDMAISPWLNRPTSQSAPPTLPEHPTPFIGRTDELKQIAKLLGNSQYRLLTLTGPGGIGKTRLATQAAQEMQPLFPRGVYFVPLAALGSVDFVVTAVAKSLGFNFDNQQDAKPQLFDFLRRKTVLLVFDNFEHRMDAASLVGEILTHAPLVKMMITSRERLNLRGEWTLEIGGMQFPAATSLQKQGAEYDAVQLFLQAMARVRGKQLAPVSDYFQSVAQGVLRPDERPHVIRICQLVDGLPLALELAAGWSNLLSCAEIVAEVEQSLDFLEGAFRDLPQRHQSLRAVFDHSWALLSDSEREVFRKLSLFRGSFDRTAAQQVAGAGLADLLALSGKSLLRRQSSGRYQVHELLRQFAFEKLAALPDECGATWEVYGRFFAKSLRRHNNALKQGGGQTVALAAIEEAFENVWAAWEWGLRCGDAALLHEMAEPLRHVYFMQNRYREGAETFARLAILEIDSPLSGLGLGFQGSFNFMLGRWQVARRQLSKGLIFLQEATAYDRAFVGMLAIRAALPQFAPQKLYAESRAIFAALDDEWGMAACDYEMGGSIYETDDADKHERTGRLLHKSLGVRQRIGDLWGEAACLYYLGHTAFTQGAYAESQRRTQQCLAIRREIGDQLGMADAYNNLGQVATAQGDYAAALSYYNEMLAIGEAFGNRKRIAACLDGLGYVAYLSREDETAVGYYNKSLTLSREANDAPGVAWSLHNLGDMARRRGAYAEAMALYQESLEIHNANDPLDWGRVVALEKSGRVALLMGELDEAQHWFREAFEVGMQMKRFREAGDALWGLTQIWHQRGEDEALALRFLTAVIAHQATAKATREKANRLAILLVGKLDEETAVSAQKEGARMGFGETAVMLLGEQLALRLYQNVLKSYGVCFPKSK